MAEKRKPFSFAHLNPFAPKAEEEKDKGKDAAPEDDDGDEDCKDGGKKKDAAAPEDDDAEEDCKDGDKESAAAVKARDKERRRWAGVLSDKAAAGNLPLACHLLSNTGMSAANVLAALMAAPPTAAAAPPKGNPLALAAMDAADNPQIGAGDGGDGKADAGAFILQSMGVKP